MTETEIAFREAKLSDLETLVALLADDPIGQTRESPGLPLDPGYLAAFEAIGGDPNQELIVAETETAGVVGMLQLTFIPSLTYMGSWRAQIEGVRVSKTMRGKGLGRKLVSNAIECARLRDCRLVQLTTDKKRPEALRFYQSLGMEATHEGMKLRL